MKQLGQVLDGLAAQPAADRTIRSRAEAPLPQAGDMPVALLVANNSGHDVDVNDRAAQLIGYSGSELLRMSVWDLTPAPNASAGRRLWRAFLEAGQMAGRYQLCRKDGVVIRADFRAWANVLPGLHVSALATPALVRRENVRTRRAAK